MTVNMKDSGERQNFDTGARRDTQTGKIRFDLVPMEVLARHAGIAELFNLEPEYDPPPGVQVQRGEFPMEVYAAERRDELIPDYVTGRFSRWFALGAKKYGDQNYQKGIPLSRIYSSLLRHVFWWAMGDTSEDHLAAVMWNTAALMFIEKGVHDGTLPVSLADAGWMKWWKRR